MTVAQRNYFSVSPDKR